MHFALFFTLALPASCFGRRFGQDVERGAVVYVSDLEFRLDCVAIASRAFWLIGRHPTKAPRCFQCNNPPQVFAYWFGRGDCRWLGGAGKILLLMKRKLRTHIIPIYYFQKHLPGRSKQRIFQTLFKISCSFDIPQQLILSDLKRFLIAPAGGIKISLANPSHALAWFNRYVGFDS